MRRIRIIVIMFAVNARGIMLMGSSGCGKPVRQGCDADDRLQAASAGERFLGQGGTQPDGKLVVELASANRIMHVTGPVATLRLEVTTERAASHPR